MRNFLFLAGMALLGFACSESKTQAELDEEIILEYIDNYGLDASKTASGLYYVIDEPGTGINPGPNSEVRVAYSGYLTDRTVFDFSSDSGIVFNLNQVIPGWTEGIQLYKEGGSGILLIPSGLAYGPRPVGTIPENSVLIFDVELLEIL